MKFNFLKVLLILTCFSSFLCFLANDLNAQAPPGHYVDTGDNDIYLEEDLNLRDTIVNVINFVLSFLGLVAVIVIIYGGFVWMTSGGEADRVNKAKKILKNGIIGLIIILISWGIVTWIIGMLGESDTGPTFTDPSQPTFDPGWGAIGSCTIDSVYPEPNQKEVPRNTAIIISFKEVLDPSSVCVTEREGNESCICGEDGCGNWINPSHIQINPSHQENNLVNATASLTEDKQTILINPQEFLGTSNSYTDYEITIVDLEKEDGDYMLATCPSDSFTWTFEVSDKLDLTPPKVVSQGVFPPPDNKRDDKQESSAERASGSIVVNDCLTAYEPAEITGTQASPDSPPISSVSINENYGENYDQLIITAQSGGQVQLEGSYNGSTDSLGVSNWQGNQVVFNNFYNLSIEIDNDYQPGNQWTINVSPQILADNLTVGSITYSFTKTGQENNSIAVPSDPCSSFDQAVNIRNVLNDHPDIEIINDPGVNIELRAKIAGSAGNNINLSTNNTSALSITEMSGGSNAETTYDVQGAPDQPRNTTIQVNFDKAMNPITLSGSSSNLENSIRVINKEDGQTIDGTFHISNGFRTVEFISDFECGENGCGETIYCLPENAHIEVELYAAPLKDCLSDTNCDSPFANCDSSGFGFSVCQDNEGNYLPTSEGHQGVMDTSFNSLDGNRDGSASGPFSFYNENDLYDENGTESEGGDNFKWSFYITDEIIFDPPKIISILPIQDASIVGTEDIEITFDSLMRSSTLRTGSTMTTGPAGDVEHRRINIFSSANIVGYWIRSENLYNDDGELDRTKAIIKHSGLSPSVTWRSQVGSGVENIYQNCFKPSSGPACDATDNNPSCCYGVPTDILGADGNCP